MLGRKTGSGFYRYEGKSKCLTNRSGGSGASESDSIRSWDGATISPAALVYLMVNEAARCLEENVVASPEDADYGMILGTGFAPLRGGPLRFADHFGIAEMVQLRAKRYGGKFEPCNLLRNDAQKRKEVL